MKLADKPPLGRLLCLAPLFLCGCISYKKIPVNDLAKIEKSSRWAGWTYYQKSNSRYHYFRHYVWMMPDYEWYKVPKNELIISPKVFEAVKSKDPKEGSSVVLSKDNVSEQWTVLDYDEYMRGVYYRIKKIDAHKIRVEMKEPRQ